MDTIFALSTARGRSGVAVIRISGSDAFGVAELLCGSLPEPGRHALRWIRRSDGEVLDRGLVLSFAAPNSFTAENTVEFQIHGSVAIVSAVEAALRETGRARPAEAGEFTRRALMNGALELAQVEALGDLISAETEEQRRQAQRMFDGAMRDFAEACRALLYRALALVEATIDFADEEVPTDVMPEVGVLLLSLEDRIRADLEGSVVAERLRDGFEVAIVGEPNVGKSTLLNRIAGRDVAITSDIAGTTRDVIEVRADLGGLPVTFLDTAGQRETSDTVERLGVERARDRAAKADLRVVIAEGAVAGFSVDAERGEIGLRAKGDLFGDDDGVSGLTGQGIGRLLSEVERLLAARLQRAGTASRDRHRGALERALLALGEAQSAIDADLGADVVAFHLRAVGAALDSLIGGVDVEAVLGEIFSEFCIGK